VCTNTFMGNLMELA